MGVGPSCSWQHRLTDAHARALGHTFDRRTRTPARRGSVAASPPARLRPCGAWSVFRATGPRRGVGHPQDPVAAICRGSPTHGSSVGFIRDGEATPSRGNAFADVHVGPHTADRLGRRAWGAADPSTCCLTAGLRGIWTRLRARRASFSFLSIAIVAPARPRCAREVLDRVMVSPPLTWPARLGARGSR
jgi:hypothetical protein